jgi:hypothetical protein
MAGGRSLPVYTTGTVTVAQVSGVWTVTGSGTNFIAPDGVTNYTLLGGDLFVIPNVGFGTVANVAGAASFTLDFWTGTTVSSGTTYKIYRYEGLPSSAVVALINQLLTYGSDSLPETELVIDTGAVRSKFDDDGGGNMRLRVRSSAAAGGDGAYVTALLIADTTGALTFPSATQLVVDNGGSRAALLDNAGAPEIAVGASGTAVGSLMAVMKADKTSGVVSFPKGVQCPADWQNNRITNGGFDVWFNGTSFTIANNASAYTAEEWIVSNNAVGGSLTVGSTYNVSGFSGHNAMTISAPSTAVGSGLSVIQRFEGQAFADTQGESNSFVASFDLSATTTAGSLTAYVQFATNTILDNGTFSSYNTGVFFTVPTGAGRVSVPLPASALTNMWRGGSFNIGFLQNTSVGSISITLGAVQLERGVAASAWAPKPIGEEIASVQRRFACSWPNGSNPASSPTIWLTSPNVSIANGGNLPIGCMDFPVHMRASPTIVLYDPTGASGKVQVNSSAGQTASATGISATMFSSIVNSSGSAIAANSSVFLHYSANARL